MKESLKVVILFSFFTIMISGSYSSFTTLLNYIHNAHGEEHQSHAGLFFILNSVVSLIFNILIPNFKEINLKILSYAASLAFLLMYLVTYLGFLLQNNTLTLVFTIIGSIFAGLAVSIVWILTGRYINIVCEIYSVQKQSGYYYGIFGSIMACNFLLGAILSATALQSLAHRHDIYLILSAICVIEIIYVKFFVKDIQKSKNISQIDIKPEQIMQYGKQKGCFKSDFKCDKLCIFKNISMYKRMLPLLPYQSLCGFMSGYVFHCSQDLVFVPDKQDKDTFLTLNLVALGVGGILGAYMAGYLSDRLSPRRICLIQVLSCLACFLLGLLSLRASNILISLITALVSGFSMVYGNNMLTVMCSKLYGGKVDSFAANRQVVNISFILYYIGINLIKRQTMHQQMYYELGIFIFFDLVALYCVKYMNNNVVDMDTNKITQIKQTLELRQVQMHIDSSLSTQKADMTLKDI